MEEVTNPLTLKKYKVRLFADSKKTQGLQPGDIVRRQYFVDPNQIGSEGGLNQIYTLMCVLESGVDSEVNPENGRTEKKPYFIGAVIQGDDLISDSENPDYQKQILDFARITNLFDLNRSGALYLTANDDEAPYLDVIDGIGRNASLCWPENLQAGSFTDSKSQYIVEGESRFHISYAKHDPIKPDHNRVISIVRRSSYSGNFEGLKQDFYEALPVGEHVMISYRARASRMTRVDMSLEYITGVDYDAHWSEQLNDNWQYFFRLVRITKSGRHLRTLKMSFSELMLNDEIQIADFNIIPLSSVSNFGTASALRIGKLDGVVDPVYGQLKGYGAYIQKLYASRAAHISGTLTAGDENGFASTFYAGKIHRNCFVNSTDISFISSVVIDSYKVRDPNDLGKMLTITNFNMANPVGIGHVYRAVTKDLSMRVQSQEWLQTHIGQRYCFSFWVYAKRKGQFGIFQNENKHVGTIQLDAHDTHVWRRVSVNFDLVEPDTAGELTFKVRADFNNDNDFEQVGTEQNPDEEVFFFCGPQLEKGEEVTQYQPTDETLNYTDTYGAWFSEGGIGGTIQNPLLTLNKDGNGAIQARGDGFQLNLDGSGHLAKGNITWEQNGDVHLGKRVIIDWDHLNDEAQDNMANRYMRILGDDTFTIIGQDNSATGKNYSPASITLSLEEVGFTSSSSQRQWFYKVGSVWEPIEGANTSSLLIMPESPIFGAEQYVTVMCVVTLNEEHSYSDTKTIRKIYIEGYTVEVVSSQGSAFKNGECQTILKANVYYQGQLLDEEDAKSRFVFTWFRYNALDLSTPLEIIDLDNPDEPNTLTLDYELTGSEIYVCEIGYPDGFEYTFPIIFMPQDNE